jgi:hypothetical protein
MRTGTGPLGLSRGNSLNVTRLASRCQTVGLRPAPPAHSSEPRETRRSEGWSPSCPAIFIAVVRGVEHVRRAVAAESNPLPSLSRTVVRRPPLTHATGADGARRHAGGGARTRTRMWVTFTATPRYERASWTRADPKVVTNVRAVEPSATPAADAPPACPEG